MLRGIRNRLTYANVMSTLAVCVALGGVSYAAVRLPKNSVGPVQIKDAVTGLKVKNSSLTGADIKDKSLHAADFSGSVAGPPGVKGDPGVRGDKGDPGAKGDRGDPGADFTAATVLGSGQSESGGYRVTSDSANNDFEVLIPIRIPLPAALDAAHVTFVRASDMPTATCPGSGHAAPGNLCVYETSASSGVTSQQIFNPEKSNGSNTTEFIIRIHTGITPGSSSGSWTVTAP